MKFLFVLAQLGAAAVYNYFMHYTRGRSSLSKAPPPK